jgi:hypothetical protein
MKTLADARDWYIATKRSLERMRGLGDKHWNDPSLADASIWQDDRFRMLEAVIVVGDAEASLKPIDDLAVVVFFSVFESQVRDYLIELMRPHADAIVEPILKEAADDAVHGVEEGSFFRRVLEPLKKQGRVSADLVTQIDQIRDYRNWVAHGRRDAPTNRVMPREAYERLSQFLGILGIAAETERDDSKRGGESLE